jgi:hypothetical protein
VSRRFLLRRRRSFPPLGPCPELIQRQTLIGFAVNAITRCSANLTAAPRRRKMTTTDIFLVAMALHTQKHNSIPPCSRAPGEGSSSPSSNRHHAKCQPPLRWQLGQVPNSSIISRTLLSGQSHSAAVLVTASCSVIMLPQQPHRRHSRHFLQAFVGGSMAGRNATSLSSAQRIACDECAEYC